MKWLITVNPFEFDIDRAFKVGEYIEIPQLDRYQIDDTIYILVQDINNNAILRYVCSVCELNIDIEESKFFEPYHKKTNQVQLIEFLTKLKLDIKNCNEDLNYQNLTKIGLNKLPILPLKNIGENKTIFDEIEKRIETSNDDQIEIRLKLSEIIDSSNSVYSRNRKEFVNKFPIDDFKSCDKDELLLNLSLCINELNEIYYKQKNNHFYYFDENRSSFLSNNSVISNVNLFAAHIKSQIDQLLNKIEDDNLLKDYSVLKLTLFSYYFDTTLVFGELKTKVSKYFKIEENNLVKFNQLLTDHLRNSFENLEKMDGYALTILLSNVFNNKNKIDESISEETKQPELITNLNTTKRILKLLKTKNYVIVKNLKYGDGYPLVERLARILSGKNIYSIRDYKQMISKSVKTEWIVYCLIADVQDDSDLNYTIEYLKTHNHKNIYVILYDFSYRDIFSLKQDYSLISTLFYEVKITPDFNDEIASKMLQDGNNIVQVNQLFALLNTINKIMIEENSNAELFSPLMFLNNKFNIKEDYSYLFENKLPILSSQNKLTIETLKKINDEISNYISIFKQ